MPSLTGLHHADHISLEIEDGTPQSLILVGVQGDPTFGDELPDQRTQEDLRVRGIQIGRMQTDEQPLAVGWQALDTVESRAFADLALFRGPVYGAGGTSPAVSTDPVGGKSLRLRVLRRPPNGPATVTTYERSYWTVTRSGARPGATLTLSAECYGRTEA